MERYMDRRDFIKTAVWVRAKEKAGTARLTAKHPRLGNQTVEIALRHAPKELL
ncbi:MAG TPA: hypothetical protein VFA02_07470 [Pseudacidobacterium sp.]|nr:hypothetical protein [Pseudacidobacterium sp.]